MTKLRLEDIIPSDLAIAFAKEIEKGIRAGSKKGFDSADFVGELNKQIAEYNDNDKARAFNEQVRSLAARKSLDVREAELEVLAQQAAIEATKNGLGNDYITKMAQLVQTRREQLATEIEQEKIQEKAEKIAEKIKKYDHERHEILEKIKVQQELMKDIFTDQRIAQAVLFTQIIRGAHSVQHAFKHIREEGFTMTQALTKTGKAAAIAFNPFSPINMKEALGSMKGLTEGLGSTERLTSEIIENTAVMAKTFGISTEMAGGLTAQLMQLPGGTAETANSTLEFAGALAKAAHVAPGEVMKEIANNSEAFATYAKDGGKNVATAAVAAKKLGMEFSSLVKMGEGLLDFESSINKQMEASVLLGREINLDKARELSLNGDLVGATQEVLKNVGGEAEFNKMNVMERKALADSLGVSVTDLGKMVQNQDKLTNLTEEQKMALADGSLTMDEFLATSTGYAGKMKEAGITTAAALGSFKDIKESVNSAKESLGGLIQGFKGGTGILGKFKGAVKGGLSGPDVETDKVSDAGKKLGGKGMMAGFKSNMKALADGLKQMGNAKVLGGIRNTALAGPALVVAVPAIPFLLFMGLTPLKQLGANMKGLASGLTAMGTGKVSLGSLNLMLFSVAAVVGVAALPFFAMMLMGKLVGAGLKGLAGGLRSMANPAVAIGAAILAGVLLSAGASMLLFGAGVGLAAAGMSLLVGSLKDVPFENLLALPFAFTGIAAGLTAMTIAGYAALPILGALTMLGVVAPALSGLGESIGGLFGGGEDDKMGELLTEIRGLRSDINRGGVINMDGQKVGEVVALALNTTGG
jgi:hypothetical protein